MLVVPTPVEPKVRDEGCAWIEPAAPPIPTRTAEAGVVNADELTVNVLFTTPFAVGVNTIVAVQLAPAARAIPQVLPETVNGDEVESVSSAAFPLLVFEMVAICG